MPQLIDRTGNVYGRLRVITRGPDHQWPTSRPTPTWICRCACGATVTVDAAHLKTGRTKSCGCLNAEQRTTANLSHGKYGTTENAIWRSMVQRCMNPKNDAYPLYGGRGITVCARWRESFENFYADMGPRPRGTSLDRIDNDGHYAPSNCRWATKSEQARNKSTTRMVSYKGRRISLVELSEATGIAYTTLCGRIRRGYPDARLPEPKRINQWA